MAAEKPERKSLRIELTPQQREALKQMGLEAYEWVEITAQQLEDRVVPAMLAN